MTTDNGRVVLVHYRGTLTDGTEFDSSRDREPMQFTQGAGEVIPGFDAAVAELEVGQSATVTIAACEAYGDRDPEAMQEFPREMFPPEPDPQEGWMVELQSEDGQRIPATIVSVRENSLLLDFNHPLAGQDLTFEIELVEVVSQD